jgi:hypothetical protein
MHIARRFGRHACGPIGQLGRVQHGGLHFRHFCVLGALRDVLSFVMRYIMCIAMDVVTAMQCAAFISMFGVRMRTVIATLFVQYRFGPGVMGNSIASGWRRWAADGFDCRRFVGCQGAWGIRHRYYLLVAQGMAFSRPS